MMRMLVALAWQGFVQLLRARLYLGVLVAGGVLIVGAMLLNELSGGLGARMFVDLGLLFASTVTTVGSALTALVSVKRGIETKELLPIVSRPVPRAVILIGRFCTTVMLATLANLLFGVGLVSVGAVLGASDLGAIFVAAQVATLEALVISGFALTFGVGSSTTVASVFTLAVFLTGRLVTVLDGLLTTGRVQHLEPVLRPVERVLPHLEIFDLTPFANGTAAPEASLLAAVGLAVSYGALYVVGLLIFAAFRFERRDLF